MAIVTFFIVKSEKSLDFFASDSYLFIINLQEANEFPFSQKFAELIFAAKVREILQFCKIYTITVYVLIVFAQDMMPKSCGEIFLLEQSNLPNAIFP